MIRWPRLVFRVLACSVVLIGQLVWTQNATPNPFSAKDNLKLFFDQKAGFKVARIDGKDGSTHPLLNPIQDFPVAFDIFQDNVPVPLKMEDSDISQAADPGYRGPSFVAGDLRIQLWGLDLQSTGTTWSAVRYELQNSGKVISTISIRLVLDTWLGENTQDHLSLTHVSNGTKLGISDETRIMPLDSPQVIGSERIDAGDGFFLLILPSKSSLLLPQRVVVANVRRLLNGGFDFEEHRAFNLLPFSVNDSAIGIFYDTVVIMPNQKIFFDVVFSGKPDLDISHATAVQDQLAAIKPIISKSGSSNEGQKNPAPLKNSSTLNKLDSLIDRLDAMMKDPHYRQGELEKLLNEINDAKLKLQPPGP